MDQATGWGNVQTRRRAGEGMADQLQARRAMAGRVLVVDDDPDVRGVVARLLEDEGFRTTEAGTGSEAVKSVTTSSPDLVLLDVMLAEDDGFDVLAAIRRTSDVPVILLTARTSENDRVLGLRLGADDYVSKPFSGPELAARVLSVLRRYAHPSFPPSTMRFR